MDYIIKTLLLNPHKPRWKPAIHQETPSAKVHLQSLWVLLNKPKSKQFSRQRSIKTVSGPLSQSYLFFHYGQSLKFFKNVALKDKKEKQNNPNSSHCILTYWLAERDYY